MDPGLLAFKDHICPCMQTRHLARLLVALEADDSRLLQGGVCDPPSCSGLGDMTVEAACPMCLGAWLADGLETVGEVEEAWSALAIMVDRHRDPGHDGDPVGAFTGWYDHEPRAYVVPRLAVVVREELAKRQRVTV